jgi:hypothetical protein
LQVDSTAVPSGDTFIVNVIVQSPNSLIGAQAALAYNPDQLSYLDTDYSGSPLNIDTPDASKSTGLLKISRFSLSSASSGTFVLAHVKFRAAQAGQAEIQIQSDQSALYDNTGSGQNLLTSVAGTAINIQASNETSPAIESDSPPPANRNWLYIAVGLTAVVVAGLWFVFGKNNPAPWRQKRRSASKKKSRFKL